MAITTIVNTDTFNTWLVRTNQLITGQNSLETSNAVLAYANAISANATAIAAFTTANLAFTNANTTHTSLVNNWGATNAAFLAANTSFANGNTNFVVTVAAFAKANAGVSDAANASTIAIASFANGNTNFGVTVAAFAKANDALPNGTVTLAGTLTITENLLTGYIVSNTNTSVTRLATGTEFRTGTSRNLALGVADIWDSAAEVSLTDSTTIAVDMSTGFNFNVNLTSKTTRTLSTPTNMKIGQSGYIRIKQGSGATAQTISSYGSGWNFAGGSVPTLSTGMGNTDLLFYQVLSTANVFGSLIKDIRLNY